jgi:hypothetical protein
LTQPVSKLSYEELTFATLQLNSFAKMPILFFLYKLIPLEFRLTCQAFYTRKRTGVDFTNMFTQNFFHTNIYSAASLLLIVCRKKLREALLYVKFTRKMLMELTTGVDFTNMFTSSFYECRSQKGKEESSHQRLLCTFYDLLNQNQLLNVGEINLAFFTFIVPLVPKLASA